MASELGAPLITRRMRRERAATAFGRRSVPLARIGFAVIGLALAGAAARVLLVNDPEGGRPSAEVSINSTRNGNPVAMAAPAATITVGPEVPAESLTPPVPELAGDATDHALGPPDTPFGIFPDLVEDSEYGPLPRVSAAGETPFRAYARASVTPATADGKALIAVVVTGLGLNPDGTMAAMSELPEAVTLAFAPYGKTLERTVGAARTEGHEVFLQVPLEPFDYPDNDPGPDTLLTGQPPRDNLKKLFNVMGKLGGYVGLINNMGARFTASSADFGPIMEELGSRGLGYLDDGSSNRSVAPQLAKANHVPFGRATMTLDNTPARAQILAALTDLEQRAKTDGSATGVISALPVSIQTIAAWSHDLEQRGFVLVPASALMAP